MPTQIPLVSIIIPTFNRAHLIEETLDSILAQTYEHWECLVVDDGGTDSTKVLIEAYIKKDARFQYYLRPSHKPKGANACRNHGFEKSTGDYIQWFDSDDRMHPEKLKLKIGYAQQYNSAIVITTHSKEEGLVLHEYPKLETFESADFYVDYILGKKPVITNDVMVQRSKIGSLRFDERLHKAQEYEFFTRLFEQKLNYCFVDVPLSFYRESEDSISKSTSKGNAKQVESLIYLSKLLQERHSEITAIVDKAQRQGRKTYKSLAKRGDVKMILKHFNFFRRVHHKSAMVFFLFVVYNLVTGKGFDKVKPRRAV